MPAYNNVIPSLDRSSYELCQMCIHNTCIIDFSFLYIHDCTNNYHHVSDHDVYNSIVSYRSTTVTRHQQNDNNTIYMCDHSKMNKYIMVHWEEEMCSNT